MLVNLIANAFAVSGSAVLVEVEVAREGDGVRVAVLDRGPGVPDAEKTAIFEKYSTSRPKQLAEGSGTGIGLTFCRLALEAMGGRVWAEDRSGGGSAFIVALPGAA